MYESFGDILRRLRKEKRLTLVELSKRSGVSNPYISQLENNRFKPTPEVIKKLAKGLELDYLFLMEKAGFLDNSSEPNYFQKEGYDVVKFEMLENFITRFAIELLNMKEEENPKEVIEAYTAIFQAMMTNYKLQEILSSKHDVELDGVKLSNEQKEKMLNVIRAIL